MKCSSCGKDIDRSRFPSNITFCPYCGDELRNADEANAMQFCPYCGERLIIQANFCPHCGKKLLTTQKSASVEKTKPQAFIEHAAKPVIESLNDNLGPERKLRKLYKQWVEFSNLPPEEIPEISKVLKESTNKKGEDVSGNDYHDYI